MKDQRNRGAWSVTVGTKGQIVIPKEARELFDIRPGDNLLVLADVDRGIAIMPKEVFEALHTSMFGRQQPNGEIMRVLQAATSGAKVPKSEKVEPISTAMDPGKQAAMAAEDQAEKED